MFLLVICEIYWQFVNTLTADYKHCVNLHDSTFIIFFITLAEIELENVSVKHM